MSHTKAKKTANDSELTFPPGASPNQESFFELREKVVEAKCEESGLNISKIFSVCGKNQDRTTFKEARVADVSYSVFAFLEVEGGPCFVLATFTTPADRVNAARCAALSSLSVSSRCETLPSVSKDCPPRPCFVCADISLVFSRFCCGPSLTFLRLTPPAARTRSRAACCTTPKAAAVLLVSNEPNDSDVLLVSFELEQMLSEIPPGQHAPKVAIYQRCPLFCVIREAMFQQVGFGVRGTGAQGCFCCSLGGKLRCIPALRSNVL